MKELKSEQEEILSLLRRNWKKNRKENLLEMIGSCFASLHITRISDAELKENLKALLTL